MNRMIGCHSGCQFSFADHKWLHMEDCPNNPNHTADLDESQFVKARAGGTISSLGAARFRKTEYPHQAKITDALDAAREFMEAVDTEKGHVIVVVAVPSDIGPGAGQTRFFSTGTYTSLEQYGMLASAQYLMMSSGHK